MKRLSGSIEQRQRLQSFYDGDDGKDKFSRSRQKQVSIYKTSSTMRRLGVNIIHTYRATKGLKMEDEQIGRVSFGVQLVLLNSCTKFISAFS